MELIRAEGICVTLGPRPVLRDVDLTLHRGEVLGLIGPNGSGKSTLIRALLGLLPRRQGEVCILGKALERISRTELARRIAYMPQGAQCYWPLSVSRVVALGRLPHLATWQGPGVADHAAVEEAMRRTEVTEFASRPVTTLSFGEKLRVLLARTLAVQSPILLADEPIASLDPGHQIQVMELLSELAHAGRGILVVLHDLTLAARFCNKLLLLDHGRVCASGDPAEVLCEENLQKVYGVSAEYGHKNGKFFVVPWDRISNSGTSQGALDLLHGTQIR